MGRLPDDYSVLGDFAALRKDIALIRTLRRLRVVTTSGDIALRFSPEAQNATLDLRALSASGATPPDTFPSPVGHAGQFLTTNGAVASWTNFHAETLVWVARVLAAGGRLTASSLTIADALIRAIVTSSYGSKIVYMLPFLGGNLLRHHRALRRADRRTPRTFPSRRCPPDEPRRLDLADRGPSWRVTRRPVPTTRPVRPNQVRQGLRECAPDCLTALR